MSADSDIATLLSHATNAAAALAANANELVAEAISALDVDIDFPDPPRFKPRRRGLDLGNDDLSTLEPGASFPAWPEVELDPIPNTQKFDEVDVDVDNISFPTLNFPTFNYPDIVGVSSFSKSPPDADTDQSLPTAPNVDRIFEPNFLSMNTVDVVSMTVSAPEFVSINTAVEFDPTIFDTSFAQFNTAIFGGVGNIPGLDRLLTELREWTRTTLDAILPAAMEVIAARLEAKQSAVLTFQSDIRNRLAERLTEEKVRATSSLLDVPFSRSGWDLPQAVQFAREAVIEQFASAWENKTNASVDAQTAEVALAYFEVCGNLIANFIIALQKIKNEEISLVLEAHQNSLAYAKAVTGALLIQYEAETFTKQDVDFQRADANIKLFEANLMVAMLEYEVARANLQAEEARQDSDTASIQMYQSMAVQANNKVRQFSALVRAARGEVKYKQFATERFGLLVSAYLARIDAHEAQIAAKIANIEGDSAKVDGQLKRAEAFETKVRGFLQKIETKQTIVEAESTRNEAIINEFEQRIKASVAAMEKSLLDNTYELKKYEVIVEDVLTDARLALREARVEMEFAFGRADGQQTAYELTQERNIELMKVELERLKAIAAINEQGAGIMASMAQGAMSAANGVAAAVLSESE